MNADEVKERVKGYLQKKLGLDDANSYWICLALCEEFKDNVLNGSVVEEEKPDDFSDFENLNPIQAQHPTLQPEITQMQQAQRPVLPQRPSMIGNNISEVGTQ